MQPIYPYHEHLPHDRVICTASESGDVQEGHWRGSVLGVQWLSFGKEKGWTGGKVHNLDTLYD